MLQKSKKQSLIELKNVFKSYTNPFYRNINGVQSEQLILKDVNFTIKKGSFIAILGDSGAGKTTFLNILAGLEKIDSGKLYSLGHSLHQMNEWELCQFRSKNIGYVFQSFALLHELNVIDNVMLPYLSDRFEFKSATARAKNILFQLGILEKQIYHYPYQLSGGEQQRVAIARALILNPSILLADEPTGNLDEQNSIRIQNLIKTIQKSYALTCILVTHNIQLAKVADHILYLNHGHLKEKSIDE